MSIRNLFFGACIIMMLFPACAPMRQSKQVENDLKASRAEKKALKSRLQQVEARNLQMDLDLRNSKTSQAELQKVVQDLEAQNAYLKKINQQLLENIRRLKQDLSKKKSVIQLQGQVIRLLDDTKKRSRPA